MAFETFRPNPRKPVGDTLGLKVGDVVTHRMIAGSTFTITNFAPGWDATCPATVVMDTGDPSIGNIAPGVFSCGARWLSKVAGA